MHKTSPPVLRLLSCSVLLLAACGGGGDKAPSPEPSQAAASPSPAPAPAPAPGAPSPSPAPAPAPGPAPAPSGVLSTCNLSNFANELLQRVNQVRAAGATCGSTAYGRTTAVSWEARLTQAADGHSRDMSARNYFSHTSTDGRTLRDRIDATGYSWQTIGENIAAGYPSVDAVMNGWMGSPGHCANVMNPSYTQIGIACVPGNANTAYSNYWTMNLGRPR